MHLFQFRGISNVYIYTLYVHKMIILLFFKSIYFFMNFDHKRKMKIYSIISIVIALVAVIVLKTSASKENSRGLTRLVGQQPLLFGRRGMNPNMNSLFFGKRAVDRPTLDDIIVEKCSRIMAACQEYAHERMGEDDI